MRDNEWLEKRFDQIWQLFFPDLPKQDIFIKFKGKWKNKFGHIKKTKKGTEIAINSLFADYRVPEDIIKITIAHEIIHYMHGFFSTLPKKYKYPHKGGVVDKELIKRGFGYFLRKEKDWFKNEWLGLYKELTSSL